MRIVLPKLTTYQQEVFDWLEAIGFSIAAIILVGIFTGFGTSNTPTSGH